MEKYPVRLVREEKTMIPADELHVVFATGAVGLAVMRELHGQGKRIRLVNRSGTATCRRRLLALVAAATPAPPAHWPAGAYCCDVS
jgi:hypothetical protein